MEKNSDNSLIRLAGERYYCMYRKDIEYIIDLYIFKIFNFDLEFFIRILSRFIQKLNLSPFFWMFCTEIFILFPSALLPD